MTSKSSSALKGKFEQGDKPQGTDYADLIDSFVNKTDTSAQTMLSHLNGPSATITTVSADTVVSTNIRSQEVSASAVYHNNPYVHMWTDVTAVTTCKTLDTTVLLNATTTSDSVLFSQTSGVATYSGKTAKFLIQANISFDVDTSSRGHTFFVIDGTDNTASHSHWIGVTGTLRHNTSIQCVATLSAASTITIGMHRHTDATAIISTSNINMIAYPINWRP